MNKSRRLGNILTNLVNDTVDFKESCESGVCSPDLESNLDTGLARGHNLLRDITALVDHLEGIKTRLQGNDK
jgi:hypothetical protein